MQPNSQMYNQQVQGRTQQSAPMSGAFNGNPGTIYNTSPKAFEQAPTNPGFRTDAQPIQSQPVQTKPLQNMEPTQFDFMNQRSNRWDEMMRGVLGRIRGGSSMGFGGGFGGFPVPNFSPGFANSQGYGYSADSAYGVPFRGGQNANLGRYVPTMFDMGGNVINQGQGGYSYNLPNAYGPNAGYTQFNSGAPLPMFGPRGG